MRTSMILISAAIFLSYASSASAQSALDGAWKVDTASAKLPDKPDVFAVKGGIYSCSSCVPAFSVPADGKPHPVKGYTAFDALAVTTDGPSSVSYIYMRGGKAVSSSTDTVSSDGATLTSHFSSSDNPTKTAVAGTSTETRVAPPPAGAHAVSGSWRQAAVGSISDAGLTLTIKTAGDRVTVRYGTGESYTATFGGPYVAVTGDTIHTMVKLRRVDANTIEETDMRAGKVESVLTLAAAADGKSLLGTSHSVRNGTTTSYTAYRR